MPSPFQGIDPFIECQGLWQDFHHGVIGGVRDEISNRLPDPYFARIDERMRVIEIPAREVRQILPDVAVLREREAPGARGGLAGTLTLEAEVIPLRYLEEVREAFIEIVHLPERRVVTVIEVLSPSNKSASGRSDYLAKRNAYIRGDVHIVELDLLLGGQRGRRPEQRAGVVDPLGKLGHLVAAGPVADEDGEVVVGVRAVDRRERLPLAGDVQQVAHVDPPLDGATVPLDLEILLLGGGDAPEERSLATGEVHRQKRGPDFPHISR